MLQLGTFRRRNNSTTMQLYWSVSQQRSWHLDYAVDFVSQADSFVWAFHPGTFLLERGSEVHRALVKGNVAAVVHWLPLLLQTVKPPRISRSSTESPLVLPLWAVSFHSRVASGWDRTKALPLKEFLRECRHQPTWINCIMKHFVSAEGYSGEGWCETRPQTGPDCCRGYNSAENRETLNFKVEID